MFRPSSSLVVDCTLGMVWPLSTSSSSASQIVKRTGECSFCHAARNLNKDGMVHQHGSRDNRCPGSNKPPALICPQFPQLSPGLVVQDTTCPSPSGTQLSQSSDPFVHSQCAGRIIKHIPRTARPHCADQLVKAINQVLAKTSDLSSWRTLLDFT